MIKSTKHQSISMTPGGNRLVYSNNPESIKSIATKYTMETDLEKDLPYIHDFYHHNNTGSTIKIGIAIKNTTSNTAKIRLRQVAIGSGSSDFQTVSANMHLVYNKSTNDQYITIPANSCIWVDACSKTIANNNMVCGRAYIIAASTGLKSRIAYGNSSCSASSAFSAGRAVSDGKSRTSALFRYDTRYATVDLDINNEYRDFLICARSDYYLNYNVNEFPENESSVLAGQNCMSVVSGDNAKSKYLLYGNYSIYYIFNFKNRNGRKITIKQNEGKTNKCLMQTDGKTWITQLINGTTGITLNMNNIETFKFVLTGSNYGNIEFIIS